MSIAYFKDHFSSHAGTYARIRPRYPAALYRFVMRQVTRRHLAWDCGTGSGQVAVDLAPLFERVEATDPSAAQIARAPDHPSIRFRLGRAEASHLAERSVDLVTVAQAAHWLELSAFYDEVTRVAAPDGCLALWGYGLPTVDRAMDGVLAHFYEAVLGRYWPPERRHIDARYTTLPFPFEPIAPPTLSIQQTWTLESYAMFLRTWSGVLRYQQANGHDPVTELMPELRRAWPGGSQTVTWPIFMRCGWVHRRRR